LSHTLVALRHPIDECSCLDAVKVLVENQKTSENTCTHTQVCAVSRQALPLWHASWHALQLYVIFTRTYSAYDWGVI